MSNTASSNAAQLKSLPVPELDDTLQRLRTVVSAISDEAELENTEKAIANFREDQGPELQTALRKFAEKQDAEHSSWLIDQWIDDYLSVREPLPTSTNVSFQIKLDVSGRGLDRAARAIRRIAEFHLMQARGIMEEECDARGNPLSSAQWLCFNGGLRHPAPTRDKIHRPTRGGANRTIGVLLNGRMWDVHVSDASGHALSTTTIRAALGKIANAGVRAGSLGFADISYLGSGELARPLAEMLIEPRNQENYQKLRDQMFAVSLDPRERTVEEHLRHTAYDTGVAWVYKPITYVIGLADDYMAMHVEHSVVDGATLVTAVKRIQDIRVGDEAAGSEAAAQVKELVWRGIPTALRESAQALRGDVSGALSDTDGTGHAAGQGAQPRVSADEIADRQIERDEAEPEEELRSDFVTARNETPVPPTRRAASPAPVERRGEDAPALTIVEVPRVPDAELDFRFSADAMSQLIMTIAQQLTYGHVRSVYESVDMREFKRGRTECLRAVTPEAVAFAEGLVGASGAAGTDAAQAVAGADAANYPAELRERLTDALEAHRTWVKLCKSGNAIDRHLWGLNFMATQRRQAMSLFEDTGVRKAREDFLSTSSVGSNTQIIRYAYAPSVPEGFGVNYTPGESTIEYLVNYWSDDADQPDEFIANLDRAAELLATYLRAL